MKKLVNNILKVDSLKYIISIILIAFCALESRAQTACTQTLRAARTVFDEGRIHELEALLMGCIDNGFSDEERTEAYRLLILSYIYLDETEKADETMLELLKDNHGFEINQQADPAELINLYNTFRTWPIFFYGPRLGANTTFVNVQQAYGVHNLNTSESSYVNQLGITAGLMIEKKFGKRITLRSDLQYFANNFQLDNQYGVIEEDGRPLVESLANETQNFVGMSVMAQFSIFPDRQESQKTGLRRWNPYVGIGGTFGYLLSSEIEFDVTNNIGASPNGAPEDIIEEEYRATINPTADLEFGLKKAVGLSFITLGVRHSYGFLNLTEKNYDSGKFTSFWGFAANDINTHYTTLFVGFLIPQYVPKKLAK